MLQFCSLRGLVGRGRRDDGTVKVYVCSAPFLLNIKPANVTILSHAAGWGWARAQGMMELFWFTFT